MKPLYQIAFYKVNRKESLLGVFPEPEKLYCNWVLMIQKSFLIVFGLLFLTFNQVVVAKDIQSIDEIDRLQQAELSQLEQEFNQTIEDLQKRKMQEIKIVKNSQAIEKSKTKMISDIEYKYSSQEKGLQDKYKKKKDQLNNYYEKMKKDILSAIPTPTPVPEPEEPQDVSPPVSQKPAIFIPPQKLIDNWKIRAGKYVGTLRFLNSDGVFVAQVRFLMYNKWDDVFNLTYDGQTVSFDYENPYGIRLHFSGVLNKLANSIRGEYLDLNTGKDKKWYAFR